MLYNLRSIEVGFEQQRSPNKELLSIQPLLSESHNFKRFQGRYFLSGFRQKLDKTGTPFVEATISDSSDVAKLYCRDQNCIAGSLSPESFVNIEAQLDLTGISPYFRLKHIESCEQNTPSSLEQLPISRCSQPLAFEEFFELVNGVKNDCLKTFIENVLCAENIGLRFIQCPASIKHHHNWHGGLLVHSVEVAKNASSDNTLTENERDLAIVAALFHDIGKTQTLTPNCQLTAIGRLVCHDQLTLDICSGALRILETCNTSFAMQLRHAWTCDIASAKYSFSAKTRVAHSLKRADGISAFGQRT